MEENINLIDSFAEFKEFKNVDRDSLMNILYETFKHMLSKKFGPDANFEVIVNIDKGDLEIYKYLEIVEDEDFEDENTQIPLSKAIKVEPDFEVGEEFIEKIGLKDFGRREILSLRQNLITKVMEFEKLQVYEKYHDRIGELITGEVYQSWKKEILVHDEEDIELILPKSEQIPADFYKKGDTIRAIVARVEMKNGLPSIILSRTSPVFIERLFEQEIPEVYDGLITIKNIVRIPGERAKVAVESYDDRIDPVGACVGMKGSRIHGIVRELRNENIDVVNYTSNLKLYISRALNPAKISNITIDEDNARAEVTMKPDQVSLAIGKGGYNIKLAGKLTGLEIEVYRDSEVDEEDVDLQEFTDEIDPWIIDVLKSIGCDTAKSVLELPVEELAQRSDLEDETIQEIIRILKSEFE
ncbi:MAG: transcription termination factor NusA [Bacteroidales bacterium]|nr:transcription termination factor NusA [Bacteroidales bacterium]MDY0216551.1 transcription termination factor NusA [Bacteroidales bacterium]